MSLEKKIILVTGANAGIGKAAATELARRGATVVVSDIPGSDSEQTVSSIQSISPNSMFIEMDVSNESSVEEGIGTVVAKFGRLDVAVNNAGIGLPVTPIHEFETAKWKKVIDVNLVGQFLCAKHQIRQFLKQDNGGVIVSVASLAGLFTIPGNSPYVASKHGTLGFVKTIAAEYGDKGIRANAVCPYYIATNMTADADEETREAWLSDTPMHRLGKLEEVANAVAFYASDQSTYCNGTALVLDGGKSIK